MSDKPLTKNITRAHSSLSGLSLGDDVTARVPRNTDTGAGLSRGFGFDRPDRTPERIAKAKRFWLEKQEKRKDKTRCPRCVGERGAKHRTCDACREKIRKAKLRARGCAVVNGDGYSVAGLAGIVMQLRREMDKMQSRFKVWQKAVRYRKALRYRTNALRKKYLKTVSQEEAMSYLVDTNHAFTKSGD